MSRGAAHLVLQGAEKSLPHIEFIWMAISYASIFLNTMMCRDKCRLCDSLGFFLVIQEESPLNQSQGDALSGCDDRFPPCRAH
jgi:hypothetical protein